MSAASVGAPGAVRVLAGASPAEVAANAAATTNTTMTARDRERRLRRRYHTVNSHLLGGLSIAAPTVGRAWRGPLAYRMPATAAGAGDSPICGLCAAACGQPPGRRRLGPCPNVAPPVTRPLNFACHMSGRH